MSDFWSVLSAFIHLFRHVFHFSAGTGLKAKLWREPVGPPLRAVISNARRPSVLETLALAFVIFILVAIFLRDATLLALSS